MDLMTIAKCKPQVIDLDKYGISNILSYLVGQGGGQYAIDEPIDLWEKLKLGKAYIVRFAVDELQCEANNATVIKVGSTLKALHFEVTASFSGYVRISIMIDENENGGANVWLGIAPI